MLHFTVAFTLLTANIVIIGFVGQCEQQQQQLEEKIMFKITTHS